MLENSHDYLLGSWAEHYEFLDIYITPLYVANKLSLAELQAILF